MEGCRSGWIVEEPSVAREGEERKRVSFRTETGKDERGEERNAPLRGRYKKAQMASGRRLRVLELVRLGSRVEMAMGCVRNGGERGKDRTRTPFSARHTDEELAADRRDDEIWKRGGGARGEAWGGRGRKENRVRRGRVTERPCRLGLVD